MKKLIFFSLCFLLILAYGCSEASEITNSSEPIAESQPEGSAMGTSSQNGEAVSQDNSSQAGGESEYSEDSSAEASQSEESSKEDSQESSKQESSDEASEDSSVIPQESSEEVSQEQSEQSSEFVPEESSEPVPEESSEPVPEESSEIPPEESSEIPPDESEDESMQGIGDAEILESGYLIYNGAAYHATSYKSDAAKAYADTYARYAQIFPNTRINVVTPPQSAISIKNPLVCAMLNDQGEVLDKMESHIYGNVNFVNLRSTFEAHKGEYLYFKSDYHWTQLGAYYAYSAFAKSIGLTPTPLSRFEKTVVTDNFIGRSNDYAHDDRILSFVDTIYAYMPTKEHTMTVYNSSMQVDRVYDNCIYVKRDSYSCFIAGDQPYTVINVPENDQNKTVLVIKESSANAFVPFLTEHYGNIIIIDPRSMVIDIRNLVNTQGVDDIIFHATASTCSRTEYNNYYRRLIGE